MAAQETRIYNLALDEEERRELLDVLEQWVTEVRDENATPIRPSTVPWSLVRNRAFGPCWRRFAG